MTRLTRQRDQLRGSELWRGRRVLGGAVQTRLSKRKQQRCSPFNPSLPVPVSTSTRPHNMVRGQSVDASSRQPPSNNLFDC